MKRARWERHLQRLWYGRSGWCLLLLPLSWLFCALVQLRRAAYRRGLLASSVLDARVIVVGNLSVGGTGKTPMVIALSACLRAAGFRVGILCRGYAGRSRHWPLQVTAASAPELAGDEAVLLAARSRVPVFAGPDRVQAGRALLAHCPCDLVICDDGLQHYRLGRDLEIALVDAHRGHGNGHCLPAGPLREPLSRLAEVNAVVGLNKAGAGGFGMVLCAGMANRLTDPADRRPLAQFRVGRIHAVAGIAHPRRFFDSLREAGLEVEEHAFPDHHPFSPGDLAFDDSHPVLMTEKDAVKCRGFAPAHWWSVPVEVQLDAAFIDWLMGSLNQETALLDKKLFDILACPVCKGPLVYDREHQELICKADRLAYPIRDDIPVMLEEEARQLAADEEA
jgi:tetraacyldisaccharide 4'-kinase